MSQEVSDEIVAAGDEKQSPGTEAHDPFIFFAPPLTVALWHAARLSDELPKKKHSLVLP